jgi:hypothetical protein
MKLFLSFILIFLPFVIFAEPIGEGCDRLREKALKYALDDLASQVEVRVFSEVYSRMSSNAEGFTRHSVRTETDIPIYAYIAEYRGSCVRVSFDMKRAPAAYRARAAELVREIDALASPAGSDSVRTAHYVKALPLYDELRRVTAAARFLKVDAAVPKRSRADIEAELAALREASGDIKQIAANIKASITRKSYYVYPPVLSGTTAVTPFGAALAKLIATDNMSAENARWTLNCEFDPKKEKFLIICALKDRLNKTSETSVTVADRKVCENIGCEPDAAYKKLLALRRFNGDIPFSQANTLQVTENTGLRGYFYTDKALLGDVPLYLKGGDIITLYARFSDNATAVVVGETKDGGAFLLPLSERSPVKAAAAGFETELIRVKIEPPYGTETLYLFGAVGDLEEWLPKYSYNTSNGIYDINGSAARVLAEFRRAVKAPYYEDSLIIYSEVGF